MIHEEIARLEKLQRLAEKIHQEAKITDSKLDDIEAWIEDEVSRLRPQLCFVKGFQIGSDP
jgi:dystonin